MNFLDAAKSGRPFAHPELIGAYHIDPERGVAHRDNVADFFSPDWLDFAAEYSCYESLDRSGTQWSWLSPADLLREDWKTFEPIPMCR